MSIQHTESFLQKTLFLFAAASAMFFSTACMSVVKVSDFEPDPGNATAAVQKALDSGAKQVIFDDPGFDYIVEPIKLRSNQELIFEDGVHVRALQGSFKGRNDCLFLGMDVENVIMRGQGSAELSMNKKDYQDPKLYSLGEWRHTVSLRGCRNVTVKDLTIRSSGGDGVYIADGKRLFERNDILLENLLLDDHHRQGVSVITVNGLVIRNCRIQNTDGTQPMCGIDFEPNSASEEVGNCLIEGTEFLNNARAGIMISCGGLQKPIDITVRNCRIAGNVEGINVNADRDAAAPTKGTIRFENCTITDSKMPLIIRNKRNGIALSFSGCEIDNLSGKADMPVMIYTEYPENCGAIDFGQFTIRQALKRKVMKFDGFSGAGLELPGGAITVIGPDEKSSVFDLKKFAEEHAPNPELLNFKTARIQLADFVPAQKKAVPEHTLNVRSKTVFFVQYCDGKTPVKIRFRTAWKSEKAPPPAMPVEIFDPAGTSNGTFIVNKEDYTYVLKGGRGIYRFCLNTRGRSVNITSSEPGFGFEAASMLELFRCTGTFCFLVPAAARDFSIMIQGSIGEPVEAELIDPAGKVRMKTDYAEGTQILKAERPENSPAEVWSLRIPRAVEDYSIRLGAPLPPLLFTAPENILIGK